MRLDRRWLMVYTIALIALIQGAYGDIQITTSGGANGERGSVSMNFDTLKSTSVSSQIAINGAIVTPSTAITGPIVKFNQIHSVKDASGKSASVSVNVDNADGLTYTSRVLPKEGSVTTQTQVSAEQWLSVSKADSIKCTAIASYGTRRSASVGLEESNNPLIEGDYVTLTGYYGKAVTTGTSVIASQTATVGEANSIKIYGIAKDSSGIYNVDTRLQDISGAKTTFQGLTGTSSAGTTTQVVQKEHVHGPFTSTVTCTPTTGTETTTTRTSNYGTEYDLNMKAAKGSLPTGIVGYYVKPDTTASKIQGAVDAAQSKDSINVAAGTYMENVVIDKSLAITGAGSTKTIIDGYDAGSVFTIGKNVKVALSDMTIQNGVAENGGGIYNLATLTVARSTISENTATYGGGIYNSGTLIIDHECSINGNTANYGGGIYSSGTGTVTMDRGSITGNTANLNGGGIYNSGSMTMDRGSITGNTANYGGGIYSSDTGTVTMDRDSITGNTANSNGGGIYNSGSMTMDSGSITGNTANSNGGGIYNSGSMTMDRGSITGNTANSNGGGIYNSGSVVVMDRGSITGNTANSNGGGIYSTNSQVTFDGKHIVVNYNKARQPETLPGDWYKGWGVYLASSTPPTMKNRFNPATQVTGNTHI